MARAPYPKEFREQIVSLHRSGRTVAQLEEEFEPCGPTIRNWVKQAELDSENRKDGLTTEEKDELERLRKENRKLRQEREILSKAAAWFAQETNPTNPNGSSNS
jgi:transposase